MSVWDRALADLLRSYSEPRVLEPEFSVSYDPVAKRITCEVPMTVLEAEREAFLRQARADIANHIGDVPDKEQVLDKIMESMVVEDRFLSPIEIRDLARKMVGCTCNLEQNFAASGDDTPDGLGVRDAEGRVIASCKLIEHAELIAWALNLVDDSQFKPCRIHSPQRPRSEEQDP
jgi:hypothetical protein